MIKVIDRNIKIPPCSPKVSQNDELKFFHIDGMYSYCTTKDKQVVYLAAWTEVDIIGEDNET